MTTSVKNIKLSPIKQLIDLNGDLTNFDLHFDISTQNIPFDALVVTQKILDSDGANLQYKNVTNGHITGNIVADKGVYDNYFLLLKSNKECDCVIKTTIKEIPVNQEFLKEQQNIMLQENEKNLKMRNLKQQHDKLQHDKLQHGKKENLTDKKNNQNLTVKESPTVSSFFTWKFVLIAIILVAGGVILWKIYNSNKDKNKLQNIQPNTNFVNMIPNNIPINNIPMNNIPMNNIPINNPMNNIPMNNIPINNPINNIPVTELNTISQPINIQNISDSNLLNKINNVPIW